MSDSQERRTLVTTSEVDNSSQTQVEAQTRTSDESSGLTNCFVCAKCRYPLCAVDDIINEPFECWKQAVYSYELDIGDREVWCYSATNTHDYRFDVARIKPPRGMQISYVGAPTDEHSWFPGFEWRMAHCGACKTHLGWGFSRPEGSDPNQQEQAEDSESSQAKDEMSVPTEVGNPHNTSMSSSGEDDDTSVDEIQGHQEQQEVDVRMETMSANTRFATVEFVGLVLTKMVSVELSESQLADFGRKVADIESHRPLFLEHMRNVFDLINRLPMVASAHVFSEIQGMEADPFLQTNSGALVERIETLVQQTSGLSESENTNDAQVQLRNFQSWIEDSESGDSSDDAAN